MPPRSCQSVAPNRHQVVLLGNCYKENMRRVKRHETPAQACQETRLLYCPVELLLLLPPQIAERLRETAIAWALSCLTPFSWCLGRAHIRTLRCSTVQHLSAEGFNDSCRFRGQGSGVAWQRMLGFHKLRMLRTIDYVVLEGLTIYCTAASRW